MACSSGSTIGAVIWEWQRKDGGFSPFPPQQSAEIEAAHKTAVKTFYVTGLGVLDFDRSAVKITSRHEHLVQRSKVSLPQTPEIYAYWTWDEGRSTFVLYSINAIVDIELAYQRYINNISSSKVDLSLCTSGLPYTIDFLTMIQTRHHYMTQRQIARKPIPSGHSLQSLLGGVRPQNFISHTTPVGTGSFNHGLSGFLLRSSAGASNLLSSSANVLGIGGPFSGVSVTSSPAVTPSGMPSSSATNTKVTGKKSGRRKRASPPSVGRVARSDTGDVSASLPDYVTIVKKLEQTDNDPCPICMCELSEESGYTEDSSSVPMPPVPYLPPVDVCKLRKCGHMMHRACLLMMLKSDTTNNGLTCPTCKKVYGTKTGDMPSSGSMSVNRTSRSLPGHPGYGSIEIVYNFTSGISNGRHFRANAFPRTCYLPDNPKGQKVLRLLKVAWERRLTFTIGTSVTTGATDTVVWNEIHHKTECSSNHSGHGYPDPNYLDNVLMELSLQGVTDDSDSDDSL